MNGSVLIATFRHFTYIIYELQILGKTSITSLKFTFWEKKTNNFCIGLPNVSSGFLLQSEGRYIWKLKLKYVQMFLQICKYIQSFLDTLAQPPWWNIIIAVHLQKTDVKTSQEVLKRLSWHLGLSLLQWDGFTYKRLKSQTPHFSADSQASGYSALTVFCLNSFSYFSSSLWVSFPSVSVLLSALPIQSLIFTLHLSLIFLLPILIFLWHILTLHCKHT